MKTFRKYILSSIAMLSMALMPTACTNEVPTPEAQEGRFSLSLSAADIQTEVQTRAFILGVDANNFYISLNEAEGTPLLVSKQYSAMTDADYILPTANGYELLVESCSETEATALNNGFGAYRFVGNATFNIVSNEKTPVSVNCVMLNAGLQLVFDQTFIDKFPVHAVTTQDSRALVFNSGNQENVAYYDMQDPTLKMSLRITGSTGGWDDRLDITREVELQKGKIVKIFVSYNVVSGARIAML